QLALFTALVLFTCLAKLLLTLTPLSAFAIPMAALAIPIALHLDRQIAFATCVAGALIAATLVPFDLTLTGVLLAQGFASVLVSKHAHRRLQVIAAGAAGGLAGCALYVALVLLDRGQGTFAGADFGGFGRMGLAGCLLGGMGGGLLAAFSSHFVSEL